MARYQVVLAYDGSDYNGFQRQARDSNQRTIQGVFEDALKQIGWQGRSILAAGRTDTGVHACGQVVAFDLDWKHSMEALQAALNASLPYDVAVQAAQEARPDFHPRYDALARSYRYSIFCHAVRQPLLERYAWRVWPPVDLERLRQAAAHLPGLHDFGAFGSPTQPGRVTIREVFLADWKEDAPGLSFEIQANAFLYHMVRRLVSFQVSIGQGALDASAMLASLESGSQAPVRGLAPPQGLVLVEVMYVDREAERPGGKRRQ
jgi:tRNA pseudouridine38-40 synthase